MSFSSSAQVKMNTGKFVHKKGFGNFHDKVVEEKVEKLDTKESSKLSEEGNAKHLSKLESNDQSSPVTESNGSESDKKINNSGSDTNNNDEPVPQVTSASKEAEANSMNTTPHISAVKVNPLASKLKAGASPLKKGFGGVGGLAKCKNKS